MKEECHCERSEANGKSRQLAVGNSQFAVRSCHFAFRYFATSLPRYLTISPFRFSLLATSFLILINTQVASQVAWNKQGGVCFRIDDNNELYKYNSFDSLFALYNYKFSTAVCLEAATWSPGYLDGLKQIWANGHEFMDHTPNHSTCQMQMTNISDTALYHGNPYVDHINFNHVCFKWGSVDTTTIHDEGFINIYDNLVISKLPGQFHDFYASGYIPMLFLPVTNKVYTWLNLQNSNPSDPDSLTLYSFWEEAVDLGFYQNIPFHKLTSFDVTMPPQVLLMLGERVLTLCNKNNMERPWNWIQPYGNYPLQTESEVAQTMGVELGYIGGATYYDEAYKTYNEYNPNHDKQFAMMFWDFAPNQLSAKENKTLIANLIAKHRLSIGQDHFVPNTPTWHAYMQRIDSILSWINAHDIPVFTRKEWIPFLFDSATNPTLNIFPPLQTDLNDDQIPDGYELEDGVMIHDDGVPQSANKSIQLTSWGAFFRINGLGGLEKGPNKFTFYTKGSPGNIIWLRINYPETGGGDILPFPADSTEWTQQITSINIPVNVSVVNIEMDCQVYTGGEVRISGMELRGAPRPLIDNTPQLVMTNNQFGTLLLDTVINDPVYPLKNLLVQVSGGSVLQYHLDMTEEILEVWKPHSFWLGSDSLFIRAVNPEGGADSAWIRFEALPVEICLGAQISLTAFDTLPGATWQWESSPYDSTLTKPQSNQTEVSPGKTTHYTLYTNGPGGFFHKDTLTVWVTEVSPATISGLYPAYCANAPPVQLYGDPGGGVFSGKAVVGSFFYPTLASVGKNKVYYTVTNPNGCQGKDSVTVWIQSIPQLFLPPDTLVCHWQTVFLNAGPGYNTYLWSTGETTSTVAINASGMSPDSTRLITLIVTKEGCPAFDTTLVRFKACTGIYSESPDISCLQIYPNPFSSSLTIENNCSDEPIPGKIMDVLGNEIRSLQIQPGKNVVELQSIPSGIYLVSLQVKETSLVRRIVKIP
ncbi:MAG: T9SS C-terminal target domain-containing protein [Bacteroidetes bacterium]|nr:MAG: T9SS C-terminal target domain-containing protein [Bacteroidota bacterium]